MSPATDAPEAVREYRAVHRYAKITARKARLIADLIRGRSVNEALETLEYAPQRAAAFYKKLVRSAAANAAQDETVNVNRLFISDCRADDGPPIPPGRSRFRPGPQGRAMPYKKVTSHLTVKVREVEEPEPPAKPAKKKAAKKKATKKAAKKKATKKTSDEDQEA